MILRGQDQALDQEADLQAAEYALGVLSEFEARAFAQRLGRDARLREALARWQDEIAELGVHVTPITPAPSVWRAIVARIGRDAQRRVLVFWRGLAVAATAAAVALGGLLFTATPGGVDQPKAMRYASLIRDDAYGVGWLVTAGPGEREVTVTALGNYLLKGEQSLELWLLPAGGKPVSLGLVPGEGSQILTLPTDEATVSNLATMAVSLEPNGGSPSGRPSGQTIAIAPVTAEFDAPYLASLRDQL